MSRFSFDEFKNAIVMDIKGFLPAQFAGAEISVSTVIKQNDIRLTGLTIKSISKNIAPIIYLESFYESYKKGLEFEDILKSIAEIRMQHEMEADFDVSNITKLDLCKNKIMPRLIGVELNKEILKRRPHVIIEDLAVTFFIDLGDKGDGKMTIPIHKELFDSWGISVERLYEIAVENLENSNQGTIKSLMDVIKESLISKMINECGDAEIANQMLDEMMPGNTPQIYVITNRNKLNGANLLLDKLFMSQITDRFGEADFFIIPSSIHECLLVPAYQGFNRNDLQAMVAQVNDTTVEVEDQLSNSIYIYTTVDGIKLA